MLSQVDGFQYERIRELDPDLILGLNAGMDAEGYDLLSQIAPTVAHPPGAEGFFSPWRDHTRMIGAAVGKADEADALIQDIDDRFAESRLRTRSSPARR